MKHTPEDGRQAILCRYHGETPSRNARVSATAQAGRVYVDWDDSLHRDDNFRAAAAKLKAKFNWTGALWLGWLPNGDAVFTLVGEEPLSAAELQERGRAMLDMWANGNREYVDSWIGNDAARLLAVISAHAFHGSDTARRFLDGIRHRREGRMS